ncbi:MAG TPA: aspartate 1-decarboxylase [Actinomycetota bacterium]|nr:aspartate 1-decarboxylase [Actinomycetota bacterium]
MKRTLLFGKVHRATITDANVNYEGSLSLDRDLMDAAGMLPYEQVSVWDVDNGARLTTYLIEGPRGSGAVVVNGAAARLVATGDKVILAVYAEMDEAEAAAHQPRVVLVDAANRPITHTHIETAHTPPVRED